MPLKKTAIGFFKMKNVLSNWQPAWFFKKICKKFILHSFLLFRRTTKIF